MYTYVCVYIYIYHNNISASSTYDQNCIISSVSHYYLTIISQLSRNYHAIISQVSQQHPTSASSTAVLTDRWKTLASSSYPAHFSKNGLIKVNCLK